MSVAWDAAWRVPAPVETANELTGDSQMPTLVKLGLVLLATILAVLLVFLVMGNIIGGPGTDSNNSDVHSNSSSADKSPWALPVPRADD